MMVVLISLLVLSLLQGVWLYFKACNHIANNNSELYEIEAAAHSLSMKKNLFIKNTCTVQSQNPNQVINFLRQKKVCHYNFNKFSYTYVLEDLGTDPCLRISNADRTYPSHHWRLTIMANKGSIMQLRFLKPDNYETCHQQIRLIENEIISWRYLYN